MTERRANSEIRNVGICDEVGERFVVNFGQARNRGLRYRGLQDELGVVGLEMLCDAPRVVGLVVSLCPESR